MIELSPTTALMLYLGATLTFLLSFWIYQHYRLRQKKILPLEKDLHVCEFCHYAYLFEGTKKLSRCPRCQSFNNHKTISK